MAKTITIVTLIVGVLIHIHTYFFQVEGNIDSQLLEFFVLSIFPYGVCSTLLFLKPASYMPLSGITAPVLLDAFTYYSVFVSPESSTASLALLWMPIWNIIIFMPLGLLIGYGVDRSKKKKEKQS